MPDVRKISIAVTGEQLQAIREAVDSGAYASASEVVRDALRGWQLREPLRKAEIERIRKLWYEGLASGPMKPYSLDEVVKEGERRLIESRRKRA